MIYFLVFILNIIASVSYTSSSEGKVEGNDHRFGAGIIIGNQVGLRVAHFCRVNSFYLVNSLSRTNSSKNAILGYNVQEANDALITRSRADDGQQWSFSLGFNWKSTTYFFAGAGLGVSQVAMKELWTEQQDGENRDYSLTHHGNLGFLYFDLGAQTPIDFNVYLRFENRWLVSDSRDFVTEPGRDTWVSLTHRHRVNLVLEYQFSIF